MEQSSPDASPAPSPSSLGHRPPEAPRSWAFDQNVTDVFGDMLARSIPQLDVMRAAVFDVGRRHARRGSAILDLGASRGDALAPFVAEFGAGCQHVALEVSEPMLAALRERFAGMVAAGVVQVRAHDLRRDPLPEVEASVVLAVLALQFVPIEHRARVVRQARDRLRPDGCFLLVEKVLGASARADEALVALYHARKRGAGYSDEEIARKALALEGVLVPQTAAANEAMLRAEGFRDVECVWRWMNFAAWAGWP